jgi:hypothetical protein
MAFMRSMASSMAVVETLTFNLSLDVKLVTRAPVISGFATEAVRVHGSITALMSYNACCTSLKDVRGSQCELVKFQ